MTRTEALGKLYKKITGEDMPIGANTTTEALQKVYEALTNDTTHHINVTKIIDDLATNWDSGGGGGGSSDFSTAEVTVKNSGNIKQDAFYPSVIMIDESVNRLDKLGLQPSAEGDIIYSIVLYQGEAFLDLYPSDQANPITEISGAIVAEEDWYVITGDCTITMDDMGIV